MKLEGEQVVLRVYLRNTDKKGWFSPPAAAALVQRAMSGGIAGATVLRRVFRPGRQRPTAGEQRMRRSSSTSR